jgi:hypothetical protein
MKAANYYESRAARLKAEIEMLRAQAKLREKK